MRLTAEDPPAEGIPEQRGSLEATPHGATRKFEEQSRIAYVAGVVLLASLALFFLWQLLLGHLLSRSQTASRWRPGARHHVAQRTAERKE